MMIHIACIERGGGGESYLHSEYTSDKIIG